MLNQKNIKLLNFKVQIASQTCQDGEHKIEFTTTVQYPAVFVYVQIEHDSVDVYKLSRNGFMQLDESEPLTLTFRNTDCGVIIEEKNIKVLTINQFMT